MKICSNELTSEEYAKAREGVTAARDYFRHMVTNYKNMRTHGHDVPDSLINNFQAQADSLNVFFPGTDGVPDPTTEPTPAPTPPVVPDEA